MKKTITRILAFVAALVCGGAWAVDYQLTNATLPQNQSNYDNRTLTLTLPAPAAVANDTVVSVSTIKIGVADYSNESYAARFPAKVTVNEATSAAGTYAGDTSIGSNAGWITYTFEPAVELNVGREYAVSCCNASDETIDDFRFKVADYNGLDNPKIITISSDSRYAPFCTVIGSYESSMPAPTFAFTGAPKGGYATDFTIGGEGGDVAKKTIGPGGTQMPMIYKVNDNDKWHPWANFTAKDTFTLAAYVNTSSCKPTEGKNGVIWSMGKKDGNRVMLVKSSNGKIKLITASGANITNESTAPAFNETAGYHLYTASFSTTAGLKLTVDADTSNTKTDSTATTKAADGFQIGSIFQGLQTVKFELGNNIGVANLIGYDSILSDSQISTLSSFYPAVAATITTDIHQDTANKEVVLMSATTDGNHFIGVSKGTMTIPAGVEVSVPHIRCLNNNATGDRATFNVAGTVNVTSESSNPNVWADRLNYKGVLFGHYHGQGTYNITGTLSAPNTYVELCYTAEAQTLNVNGGTVTTKGIHSNNGQGTVNLSNSGRIALSTSTFMNVPVTVTGGTIAAGETATYAKQLTVSSGELALEVGAEKTLTLNGGVSNSGTISVKTGTVVIPAGSEGVVTVAEGATLKLRVTDVQIATGYTATNVTLPAGTDIVFVNAQGETVEGGSGNTLAPAAVVWTGEAADNNWNTPGNWSTRSAPTSETFVRIEKDATITLSDSSQAGLVIVSANITFTGTSTAGNLKNITTISSKTITVDSSEAVVLSGLAGGTLVKNGTGTLSVKPGTGANVAALANMNVVINNGKVMIDQPTGTEATINEVAFTIAESACGSDKVPLDCYGWFSATGPWSVETTGNARIFNNNGYESAAVIKGSGNFTKLGTGTVEVLCAIGNADNAYSGTVTVSEGTLRINTACTATIKLTAGTIKSPNELTVEKTDANKKIVTSTETEDETTIHVWSLAQRDPTTVYATQGFNSYKLDANTVVTLVDGDTIVCNRGYMGGNNWGGGKDLSSLANKGHKIIIEHEMDLGGNVGIPAAMQVEVNYRDYSNIEDRKGVYLYGSIGENAQISGTGALFLGFGGDCTIADGVTISCDTGFQSSGKTAIINGTVTMSGTVHLNGSVIKLGTAQAKLIVNEAIAANGVQSGVENKFVKYDATTKTYSLCDLIELNAKKTGLVVDAVGAEIKTVAADGTETPFSDTTIPLDTTAKTALYRITAGSVTKDVGVIVAKEAGSALVTTLVAVPFANFDSKSLTIDSLLVKSNLSDGDEIMAWHPFDKKYYAWSWSMSESSWTPSKTVTKYSMAASAPASSYDLYPGQAVWVRTAGKIVVYGTLPASDIPKVKASDGVNLLGNRAMTDAKPEEQVEVKTGDFVEIPGDTKGVRQYEKTGGGWKATWLPVPVMVGDKQLEINGAKVWETKTPTDDAPSVPAGRGYFLKRPEAQSTSEP